MTSKCLNDVNDIELLQIWRISQLLCNELNTTVKSAFTFLKNYTVTHNSITYQRYAKDPWIVDALHIIPTHNNVTKIVSYACVLLIQTFGGLGRKIFVRACLIKYPTDFMCFPWTTMKKNVVFQVTKLTQQLTSVRYGDANFKTN